MHAAESAIGVKVRSSASGAAVLEARIRPFGLLLAACVEREPKCLAVSGRGWRNSFAPAQPYEVWTWCTAQNPPFQSSTWQLLSQRRGTYVDR